MSPTSARIQAAPQRRWLAHAAFAGAMLLAWLALPASADAQGRREQPAQAAKQSAGLRVFGTDEREVVNDTTQFPWSAVGLIEALWHQDGGYAVVSTGTGTLIGNQVVLTGGHVVYDHDLGWADEVVYIAGKNGSTEPFGRAWSVRTITQRAWIEDRDNRYDLAMIVLDRPIGEQAGYMSVAVEPEGFFEGRNLNSSGYPGEDKPGDTQYHSYGTSIDVQDGLIRHYLDSEPGQSGSPLWAYEPDTQTRRLVGVLTGSREVTSGGQVVEAYNVGVHINATFAAWIQDTLSSYDTAVQEISVNESTAGQDAFCGAGAPFASLGVMLMLPLMHPRSRGLRRR